MSKSPQRPSLKTIHKVRFDADFCIVANSVAQSDTLSLEARGLLLYLISLPDTWQIRMDALQEHTGKGKYALRRIIHELQAAGHMHRFAIPSPNADSFSGSRWNVFANPADLADRLSQTSRPKGFHRRPSSFQTVQLLDDVHKETVQATEPAKNTQRPTPPPAELAAFLDAHGLSQRVAATYFAADDAYQTFAANTDGTTPPARDWRTGLLSFATKNAAA